jgi:carbonic anhydrase
MPRFSKRVEERKATDKVALQELLKPDEDFRKYHGCACTHPKLELVNTGVKEATLITLQGVTKVDVHFYKCNRCGKLV